VATHAARGASGCGPWVWNGGAPSKCGVSQQLGTYTALAALRGLSCYSYMLLRLGGGYCCIRVTTSGLAPSEEGTSESE
jgi:hypothetical protein